MISAKPMIAFGEADDRVQWRFDLMHQLAQRGGIGQQIGKRRQLRGRSSLRLP
jgi:hypothetical protein